MSVIDTPRNSTPRPAGGVSIETDPIETDPLETDPGEAVVIADPLTGEITGDLADDDPSVTRDRNVFPEDGGRKQRLRWWLTSHKSPEFWFGAGAVVLTTLYLWLQLTPSAFFTGSLPWGGDSTAHVWGPAFMRDNLLNHGRITGWSKDWFAGFPAFTFYFPLPAMMVVGLGYILGYGDGYKWVMAAGILGLPFAMYVFGRCLRLPFPVPALMSIAAARYLFDHWYNIYGGNMGGVFVGEYSYSISLCCGLIFLGLYWRALHTGRGRALAAVFLWATCWSHILPTIWVAATAIAMTIVMASKERIKKVAAPVLGFGFLLTGIWLIPFQQGINYTSDFRYDKIPYFRALLFPFLYQCQPSSELGCASGAYPYPSTLVHHMKYVMLLALIGAVIAVVKAHKGALIMVVSGLLCAIAVVHIPGHLHYWNTRILPYWFLMNYAVAAYAVGEIARGATSLVRQLANANSPVRQARATGAARTAIAVGAGLALMVVAGFLLLGIDTMVKNAPWWITPLIAVGVWGYVRRHADYIAPRWPVFASIPLLMGVAAISIGVHEDKLPTQAPFNTSSTPSGSAPYKTWARSNFLGFQGDKAGWPIYQQLVTTMKKYAKERGCGRVFLEYPASDGSGYAGGLYALWLLPYWTDGCLGTAQGIYFEGSATTFAYYLTVNSLSKAQETTFRFLPYQPQDVTRGVKQAKNMGMKYILAFDPETVAALKFQPGIEEVGPVNKFTLFELTDSKLVEPLQFEPNVVDREIDTNGLWMSLAAPWFNKAEFDPPIAQFGPKEWARVDWTYKRPADITDPLKLEEYGVGWTLGDMTRRPLPPITVSNIVEGQGDITFTVSEPGVPVLVKESYFPNWQVSGAKGPYRVTPNFMVVIPTEKNVHLHYGYSTADKVGHAMTAAGVIGTGALAVMGATTLTDLPWIRRRRNDGHEAMKQQTTEELV